MQKRVLNFKVVSHDVAKVLQNHWPYCKCLRLVFSFTEEKACKSRLEFALQIVTLKINENASQFALQSAVFITCMVAKTYWAL